jgi:hypothetical protein
MQGHVNLRHFVVFFNADYILNEAAGASNLFSFWGI